MLKYLTLLRFHQWTKNLLLLFPPFFGGTIISSETIFILTLAFFSFCAAASSGYIINDIMDAEADRNHLQKKKRPVASGDISATKASLISLALFLASLILSLFVSGPFLLYIFLYMFVSLSYTFFFKDWAIFDIFVISLGFLIRVLAGGEAFDVEVSDWLFMSVFLVALFLATGKRMGELVSLGDDAQNHRKSLALYSSSYLEGVLWFSAASALVTYSLYTIEQRNGLFYTVPLAAFGLLRYIYIVKDGRGDPTEALLKDGQIMGVGIVWAVVIGIIIYS